MHGIYRDDLRVIEKAAKSIIDHFFFRWHQSQYHPGELHDAMRKEEGFEVKEAE